MAEYINGVNAFGNMSVTRDKVRPDIQTGRNAYVDNALMDSDEVYAAKVNSMIAEGFTCTDLSDTSE